MSPAGRPRHSIRGASTAERAGSVLISCMRLWSLSRYPNAVLRLSVIALAKPSYWPSSLAQNSSEKTRYDGVENFEIYISVPSHESNYFAPPAGLLAGGTTAGAGGA